MALYNEIDINPLENKYKTPDIKQRSFGRFLSGLQKGVTTGIQKTGSKISELSQTPEGRRLLSGILTGGAALLGASPTVTAEMSKSARRAYERDIQRQDEQQMQRQMLFQDEFKQQSEETQAKLKLEDDYRKEYNQNRVVKDSKEINAAISRMDNVWNEYLIKPNDRGKNALDQALVITFNKMLDPGSVVRESEFARTPVGQSLLSRMKGYQEKLAKGGVGLTDPERKEIIEVAKQLQQGQMIELEKEKQFYIDLAEQRGLNIENIFGKTKTKKTPDSTTPDLKEDENKTGSVIKLKSGYSMELLPDA